MTALALEPGHHIDENQLGHHLGPGAAGDFDSGEAAHAGADQHHRTPDLGEHRDDITGQVVDGVLAGRRAVAVAVTTGVQGDHVESPIAQDLPGVLPREPVLAPAVQHEDGGLIGAGGNVAIPLVAHQRQGVVAAELHRVLVCAHRRTPLWRCPSHVTGVPR